MAPVTLRPPDATVRVFVFKEGVAKALGHDIELAVEQFRIDVDAGTVQARFDTRSLRTLHAIKDGRPDERVLSADDKETIDESVASKDILDSRAFPECTFTSTLLSEARVEGALTLRGVTRPIACPIERAADGAAAVEVVLDQTAFGIKPFRALGGVLKVKPNVIVRLRVPWRAAGAPRARRTGA